MPVVLIEGPEKAGKSTLARALNRAIPYSTIRKFAGPMVGDEYSEALRLDTAPSLFSLTSIWDRGWPSEWVYSSMLGRESALTSSDAAILDQKLKLAGGMGIVLLGPSAAVLRNKRDSTDLDVSVSMERANFREYARKAGWPVYDNMHDESTLAYLADLIYKNFEVGNAA